MFSLSYLVTRARCIIMSLPLERQAVCHRLQFVFLSWQKCPSMIAAVFSVQCRRLWVFARARWFFVAFGWTHLTTSSADRTCAVQSQGAHRVWITLTSSFVVLSMTIKHSQQRYQFHNAAYFDFERSLAPFDILYFISTFEVTSTRHFFTVKLVTPKLEANPTSFFFFNLLQTDQTSWAENDYYIAMFTLYCCVDASCTNDPLDLDAMSLSLLPKIIRCWSH